MLKVLHIRRDSLAALLVVAILTALLLIVSPLAAPKAEAYTPGTLIGLESGSPVTRLRVKDGGTYRYITPGQSVKNHDGFYTLGWTCTVNRIRTIGPNQYVAVNPGVTAIVSCR